MGFGPLEAPVFPHVSLNESILTSWFWLIHDQDDNWGVRVFLPFVFVLIYYANITVLIHGLDFAISGSFLIRCVLDF